MTEELATGGPGVPDAEGPDAGAEESSGRGRGRTLWIAGLFLVPALVILGALVVYPIFFSVIRSFFDRDGNTFVGIDNYQEMFTSPSTLTAIRNNLIWVIVAPTVVTAIGLIFAVLTERIRWSTAFKVAVFMPMAISFLSAGVTWRLVYEQNPDTGLANAAASGIAGVFSPPGAYPGARSSDEQALAPEGTSFLSNATYAPGDTATLGLVAIPPEELPTDVVGAVEPTAQPGEITGVVWFDFTKGGGGEPGVVDPTEQALPGVDVEAVSGDGAVAASASTGADGTFAIGGLPDGDYQLRLAESSFREPFAGFGWLGPTLVTPAIIVAYIWIWAGFAMVVIGAGLAAIPRESLEAARVDGATEWQVFHRVTAPLLAPVLGVVLVTLVINVLKVFDLVLVIAPGSVQANANVIALQMWKTSFGGARDFGLGSALAVFLFVLVLPAMAFNLRRFKTES